MHLNEIKRGLSFVIALVMVFLMVPVQAYASETGDQSSETQEATLTETTDIAPSTEPIPEETHSNLFVSIQTQIDSILKTYLLTEDTSAEGISLYVASLDDDRYWDALIAVDELENVEDLAQLTEAEQTVLIENNKIFSVFASALYTRHANDNSFSLFTAVTVLDGQISISDSANTLKESSGTVTATARGSLFSKKTNNVTIKNDSGSAANLKFNYSASSTSSFSIDGSSAGTSGNYSIMLNAGSSVTISITSNSGLSNTTATLTMNNFSLTAAAASSKVKFEYDASLGSVTVDSAAISSGVEKDIPASGATLAATTKSGATFYGWIDAKDNSILSTSASYKLEPAAAMTVKAVFLNANSVPHFYVSTASQASESVGFLGLSKLYYYTVGKTYLFDNLNNAITFANTSNNKYIVLANSATLPAGDYTIPVGVTLLIPFDANNTLYTTAAQPVNVSTRATPTAFRTLTMASGANITVNGSLGLSAMVYSANGGHRCAGMPYDNYGHIKMERNSSISVGKGGNMYVYGYITGSGEVTAASGATLYESFVIEDFRGGKQTTKMENGVFPFNQYYIQSIEVPLTINSGANLHAYTCLNMSNYDFPMDLIFLGSGTAMLKLSSGSAKKWYDGSQDRLHIEINGNMSISPIDLEISGTTINSEDYELPVNGNISISLNTGKLTIAQDLAILPGTQIDIAENASVELGSGTSAYVYDGDNWGNFSGATPQPFIPAYYAPSRTYTRTTADLVDASINVLGTWDASNGYVYTTSGGANIHSKGNGIVKLNKGTEEIAYQLVQGTENTEIPITPAKLKHEDGSYLETDSGTYNHDHYTCAHDSTGTAAAHGKWYAGDHNITNSITTAASCTNDGIRTYACPCGYSYTEVIPATGHTEVIDEAVPATCTETGLTEGKHCSVCNTVLEAQQTVPVLSHSYSNWVVTTKPGLTTVGMQTGSCVCGDTDTVEFTSCHIGDTNYSTLAEALEDVGDGGTIYLDAEFNPVEVIPVTQHVIFDTTKGSASFTGGAASDGWIYKRIDGTNTITIQKATVEVMFTNIAVSDGLDLHFYVNSVDLMDNVTYTAVVTKHFSDGRNDSVKTIPAAAWVPYSSSLKEFVFEDISAKEMTDAIEVKIYQDYGTENQLQVNTTLTETVQKYVIRTLRDISKEATLSEKDALLRTALVDMLYYGAAAQSFFGYNSEVLATEEPTGLKSDFLGVLADNLQYATSDVKTLASSQIKGSNFAGVTVSATNKLMFTFYFNISDPTGMEATVTYTDHNGKPQSRTVLGEDFYKRSTGLYGVDVLNMSIVDGRQLMNCKVSLNGNEIARASDSVEGYAARKTDGNNDIFEQMMKFVDSACAYFDKVKATKNS